MFYYDILLTASQRKIIFFAFDVTTKPRKRSPFNLVFKVINSKVKIVITHACNIYSNLLKKGHHLFAFEESAQIRRCKNISAEENYSIMLFFVLSDSCSKSSYSTYRLICLLINIIDIIEVNNVEWGS